MKGKELRAIRHRFGAKRGEGDVSAREFGEIIGVSGNSVLRQERGELGISEPVARLARLLDRHPELADELRPRTRKK